MKILTVLTYYRPHTSGLTIYAERLARAFAKRGHQVTVMTTQYDKALQRVEMMDGVRIVRVPVALMAEVKVNENTGEVLVKRVVCAQDLGLIINPEGAALQIEGCITMGLGYSLQEHAQIEGGRVLTDSFKSYKLPRFSQLPQIEYVNLETDKFSAKGGGEPAIVCMGGVIANAIHDAIGIRVTMMPMTADLVKGG